MIDTLSAFDYALWAAGLLLQSTLAVVIYGNHHDEDFPAFAAYLSSVVLSSLILLILSLLGSPLVYFYAYFVFQVFILALVFCVIHEVFEAVTDRAKWLSTRGKRVMIRVATLAAVIAIAASLHVPESRFPVMESIVSLQRGLGLAAFSFMAVFVVFARSYSIAWHRRDSGIALGIFLGYSFQTLWPSLNAYLSATMEQHVYTRLVLCFDALASFIWLYCFVRATRSGDLLTMRLSPGKFHVIAGGKQLKAGTGAD